MSKVKVRINAGAAQALLNSPEVQADLLARAEAIAAGAGEGFIADVRPGLTRAHAMAKTTDWTSRWLNARENSLLKNLDRGRT